MKSYSIAQQSAMMDTIGSKRRRQIREVMSAFDSKVNYAGADGDWKSALVPQEGVGGANWRYPAWAHDGGYELAARIDDPQEREEARKSADRMFLCLMLDVAELQDYAWGTAWISRRINRVDALAYYAAVREHGGAAVEAARKKYLARLDRR